MKRSGKLVLTGLAVCAAATCSSAFATESGVANPPLGADGFLAGALPPPGTYGLMFYNNYTANRFNDGNGNSLIPGFKVKANVLAAKVLHMTSTEVFGGQLGFYGAIPLVDLHVEAAGRTDKRTAFGDLEVGPILGWHSGDWHWYGLATLVAPTGAYDAARLANAGVNYTTFRPQVGFSYLPKNGLDISARITYSINSKNQATNYKSGQYLHADYNVGYAVSNEWKVGLQGYYLHQTTNDEVGGVKVGADGFKGRVLAIGPGIFYQGKSASFEVRYLTETLVENRPKGNSFWVKSVFKF